MFIINCQQCDTTYLLSDSVVESRHATSSGIIGYVKCPEGHRMVQILPDAYPKPPPPTGSAGSARRNLSLAEKRNQRLPAWSTQVDACGVFPG